MIFSGNLRRLMARDRVKQKDLARALGVVQGAVSAWVNGQTPDFPNQQKLAKYFGVTVAELFTDAPSPESIEGRGKRTAESEARRKPEAPEVRELREQFEELIARSPEAVSALKPILSYLAEGKQPRRKQ